MTDWRKENYVAWKFLKSKQLGEDSPDQNQNWLLIREGKKWSTKVRWKTLQTYWFRFRCNSFYGRGKITLQGRRRECGSSRHFFQWQKKRSWFDSTQSLRTVSTKSSSIGKRNLTRLKQEPWWETNWIVFYACGRNWSPGKQQGDAHGELVGKRRKQPIFEGLLEKQRRRCKTIASYNKKWC